MYLTSRAKCVNSAAKACSVQQCSSRREDYQRCAAAQDLATQRLPRWLPKMWLAKVAGKNWLPNVSTVGYKGKGLKYVHTDKVQKPKEREKMRQPIGSNALQPKQPQPKVSANANQLLSKLRGN